MLAMCRYHQAMRSVEGLRKRHTSRPAMERPTRPKTMATVESVWNCGVGLTMPRARRDALAAKVITAATQSSARGRWPRSGALAEEDAIAGERRVEAEDRDQLQEEDGAPVADYERGGGNHRHRPEIYLAPPPVSRSALGRQESDRRDHE